jgi:uncharacterized protein YbgA (DUF1722 family)
MKNWALVAEVARVAHWVVVFPQVPQPVQAPLLSLYTWMCGHPSYHNSTCLFQTWP